ncbi:hypothetical protein V6N12_013196 [Hibiscus sabdariffa]|uniref:Uncharacterized protein n=1 Tax=Hibiscus sabdariffa TaxID=183260 RepID=A0ABR2D5S9_9ROSI
MKGFGSIASPMEPSIVSLITRGSQGFIVISITLGVYGNIIILDMKFLAVNWTLAYNVRNCDYFKNDYNHSLDEAFNQGQRGVNVDQNSGDLKKYMSTPALLTFYMRKILLLDLDASDETIVVALVKDIVQDQLSVY